MKGALKRMFRTGGRGMRLRVLLLAVLMSLAACGSSSGNQADITAEGTIKEQGGTTYMYGTHVLLDDAGETLYALKSGAVNLDSYIDRKVTVKGDLVEGYPVDGGPYYLDVKFVLETFLP